MNPVSFTNPMNYEDTKKYLDSAAKYGSVYGLESIRELLRNLGNPQNKLKFIHIAGTNGKGSAAAFLNSISMKAGYKTGCFTSPELDSFREMIQIGGVYIEKSAAAAYAGKIRAAADKMASDGLPRPTLFEIETAMSFLFFSDEKCDPVVLETGLGGLEDATNIVETSVMEIITPVSMDHMNVLGNTLPEIAAHKAGIIKKNTRVVTINQSSETLAVIKNKCYENNCDLILADTEKISNIIYGVKEQKFSYESAAGDFYGDLKIKMAGMHQINNAVLALEAARALNSAGYVITDKNIYDGLADTDKRGRFTVICENPIFIIDGAHNESAAFWMSENIKQYFKGKKIIFLVGIFKDKEYEKIISQTADLADEIITVSMPGNKRLLSASELAETVGKYNKNVQVSVNVADAVEKGFKAAGGEDVIIAFGSFSFLKAAESAVKNITERLHNG